MSCVSNAKREDSFLTNWAECVNQATGRSVHINTFDVRVEELGFFVRSAKNMGQFEQKAEAPFSGSGKLERNGVFGHAVLQTAGISR